MNGNSARRDLEELRSPNWTKSELIARVAWAGVQPLFRISPRPLWGFRRGLLRLFGARIGSNARIHPSAKIWMPWNVSIGADTAIGDGAIVYALGAVRVGAHATVSQGAHLCAGTHDYRQPHMRLVKSKIDIADGAWICAEAFVGPDVRIGEYAIVGARAVAMSDVDAWTIVIGNPARILRTRDRFA